MTARLKEDLLSYAHPPVVVSLNEGTQENIPPLPPLEKPAGFTTAYHNGGVDLQPPSALQLQYPHIPLELKIRVLWSDVRAFIDDLLL